MREHVLTLFSHYDVIFEQETHLDRENCKDLYIPGFATGIHYLREKRKKAQKSSGGISVFVKKELREQVRFLPQNDSDIVWVHVPTHDKNEQDTFIGCCYITTRLLIVRKGFFCKHMGQSRKRSGTFLHKRTYNFVW